MILYYSGTGNSKTLALALGKALGDEVVSLNEEIKAGRKGKWRSERPFVLVVPAYAWRIPRLVEYHLRGSNFDGSNKLYVLMTCGSSGGAAARYCTELCRDLEMDFMGFQDLPMPENYVAVFSAPSAEESERIIQHSLRKIPELARLIAEEKEFPARKISFGDRFFSKTTGLFYRLIVKDKAFRVDSKCTGCGLCLKLCPLNNIRLDEKKPKWQGHCTHCMACICACPETAIEYGRHSVGKRRYYLNDIECLRLAASIPPLEPKVPKQ